MSYKELIVRYNEFKPTESNVTFQEAKPNKSGQGKSARFNYNKRPLYLQTQKLRNPFGFSRGVEGTPQYGKKFTCTFSFDLKTEAGREFRDQLKELEELVAQHAYENRVEWELGRNPVKMTKEEVRKMMTPIVKVPLDKKTGEEITEYPPTFRVTFNTRTAEVDGEEVPVITSEVYDQEGQRLRDVNEDTIRSNSSGKVLMYATSVWITPQGYGVNFRVHQMKVYPNSGMPMGQCVIDDDDSEDGEGSPVTKVDDEQDQESEEDEKPKRLSLRKNTDA